ncbi:myristylated tegument protein [Saimiriine betaherpesvirus 4]|uniref:Cytoplasmic envelopment protein 3 n=1 Tax=Saimiriine betaherpesvirus 4 TaxID=1535247 RepID=G8XT03_9BETA|nr:myristylated tegument protein [Saimiriine betaherpesvirus 4]AEV80949.1 myristylated tegument protein [Saimiriine betaherpesvirus 4]
MGSQCSSGICSQFCPTTANPLTDVLGRRVDLGVYDVISSSEEEDDLKNDDGSDEERPPPKKPITAVVQLKPPRTKDKKTLLRPPTPKSKRKSLRLI